MNDVLVEGLVSCVGFGLTGVAIYFGYLRWWTPERQRTDASKWSQRHLAPYDERWSDAIHRELKTNFGVDLASIFLLTSVLMQVPTSGKAYAACLIALPTLLVTLNGLAFNRVALPPGVRVARMRELTLTDYLPHRTRRLMWVSGVAGCLTCVVLGVAHDQWVVALSGLLLLIAPACVEWVASQLARMPEPAENAAHLYVQDAFRADLIRASAIRSATGGTFVTALIAWEMVLDDPGWVPAVLLGVGILLTAFLFNEGPEFRKRPADYMRSRLWPSLRPAEVLQPGDPVPVPRPLS